MSTVSVALFDPDLIDDVETARVQSLAAKVDAISAMYEAMFARSLAEGHRDEAEYAATLAAAATDGYAYKVATIGALPGSATNGEAALITSGADAGKVYLRTAGAWVYGYTLSLKGLNGLPMGLAAATLALPRVTAAQLADDVDASARLRYTTGDGVEVGLPASFFIGKRIDLSTLDDELPDGVTMYGGDHADLTNARLRLDVMNAFFTTLHNSGQAWRVVVSGVVVWAPSETNVGPQWGNDTIVCSDVRHGGAIWGVNEAGRLDVIGGTCGFEMADDCLDKASANAKNHGIFPLPGMTGYWGIENVYVNNRSHAQDWTKFSGPKSGGNWAWKAGKASGQLVGISTNPPNAGAPPPRVWIVGNLVTNCINSCILWGGPEADIEDNHCRNSDHDHPYYIASLAVNASLEAKTVTFTRNTAGGYGRGVIYDVSNTPSLFNHITDVAPNPQRAANALNPGLANPYEYYIGEVGVTIRPKIGGLFGARASRRGGSFVGCHARVDLDTAGLSQGFGISQPGFRVSACSIEHTGAASLTSEGSFKLFSVGRGQGGAVVQGAHVEAVVSNAPSGIRVLDHARPARGLTLEATVRWSTLAPAPADAAPAIRSVADLIDSDLTIHAARGANGACFSRLVQLLDTDDRPARHEGICINGDVDTREDRNWFTAASKTNALSVTDRVTLHGRTTSAGPHASELASTGGGHRPCYGPGAVLRTVTAESTPATYTVGVKTASEDDDGDVVAYTYSHALGVVPSSLVFTDIPDALLERYAGVEFGDDAFTVFFEGDTETATEFEGYLVVRGPVPCRRTVTVVAGGDGSGGTIAGTVLTSPDRIEFAHGLAQHVAAVEGAFSQTAGAPSVVAGYPKSGDEDATAVIQLSGPPTAHATTGDRYRVEITI